MTPVANVIRLFTAVGYDVSKYARTFVSGKLFQSSLMFAGKAGVYPRVKHQVLNSMAGSWHHPQILG